MRQSCLGVSKIAVMAGLCAAMPTALYAQATDQTPIPTSSDLTPRTENGRQIYDLAQFARFNPRTALDIVGQIPGFIITDNDDGRRGLGQASQNILINGQRISGKNNDALTTLSRISSASVLRVEIVDGASLSISGLSGQVANVVTASEEEKGTSGNFKWRPQWREAGNNWFAGEASLTTSLAGGSLTLALANDAFRNGVDGPEDVTDRRGNLLFERDEVARYAGDRPKISAAYNRTSAGGSVFNANLAYERFYFNESVATDRTQTGAPDIFELYTNREREWNFEGSADYDFALGGGRLKLIGLQRLEHSAFSSFFGQTFADGTLPNGSIFDQVADEGESILRAEYGWKTSGGSDWNVSLEGAYNFLDNIAALSELDPGGVFQPVPLPDATSKVTEKRAEFITTYGRPLSSTLTLQAAAGAEYSTIGQSGTRGKSRSFVRPKGSVSMAWKPSDTFDLSVKLSREVGQLNFFDFVASVDVSSNTGNAGNPGLVPPQSWRAELEATKKLGPWGSATVNIYGEKISDIVDAVPITATTEALGNLPSANLYGVKFVASFLLDPLGWKGAKLDIDSEVRKSALRDPLLGNIRAIGNEMKYNYEVSLRHDVPGSAWAWGGGVQQDARADFLRLDQTNSFHTDRPYAWVFVEHKNVFGLTVNANLGNLLGQREKFVREFYVDRRDGPLAITESRARTFGLIYRLTVSGSF